MKDLILVTFLTCSPVQDASFECEAKAFITSEFEMKHCEAAGAFVRRVLSEGEFLLEWHCDRVPRERRKVPADI